MTLLSPCDERRERVGAGAEGGAVRGVDRRVAPRPLREDGEVGRVVDRKGASPKGRGAQLVLGAPRRAVGERDEEDAERDRKGGERGRAGAQPQRLALDALDHGDVRVAHDRADEEAVGREDDGAAHDQPEGGDGGRRREHLFFYRWVGKKEGMATTATTLADVERRLAALEHRPVYDNWFKSTFSFHPPYNHNLVNLMALSIGAIFAGWTATAMPPAFLAKFESWPVQYLVFVTLSFSTLSHPITPRKMTFVVLDALLLLLVFRAVMHQVQKAYAP